MSQDRRGALGALGERLAGEHLERLGFRVLERNFRTRFGELDLVAGDSDVIVFCEVKTRVARDQCRDPLESLHDHKRRQVRRTAARWLVERPDHPVVRDLRFDAIGITLAPDGRLLRLDHLKGAF